MRLLPRDKDVGWVPYLWLIYISMALVFTPWGEQSRMASMVTVACTVVFLPAYFGGYWVKGRQLLWIIALITLLGMVLAPFNPGAAVFFVYAAAFAPKVNGTRTAVKAIAAVVIAIVVESLVLQLTPLFWTFALIFTVVIGAVNTHFAERHRANQKLLLAQEEVERMAKIAERERIGRDLHDVLGHTLSLIVLKSELASKLADKDPARAAIEIRDVERIGREALAQVRSTVRGYQSRSLQAEAEQAKAALQAAGVEVLCDFTRAAIPASYEGVLALALREAVTNIIRHAGAKSCNLRLEQTSNSCCLEIKDDGCGELEPEGVGLSGMRQRVEALGGSLRRESSSGTRLIITLPATLK
jgi:two-component system, NarL family, sensor histidine kinase DesK